VADEHFNDLIRKGNGEAKLIVIDPDIESVVNRVCQTLSHDKTGLRSKTIQELECRTSGRLMFVRAKAEEVTSTRLLELLRD
jgi:PBP1b-binding outer membrane lipoprotein LpoB